MRMWIDTEFNEYRGSLISMALVAEDGGAWYGVRFCDDPGWWVREHVMPYLNREPARDADLRVELEQFLGQYDSVHIVADWPGDIAHFCNFLEYAPGERIGPDRMTFEVRRDLPDTAKTSAIPHNALEDARALARGAVAIGVATDQPAGWHVSFDGGLTWEYHADDPWGRLGERVAIVRPLIYGDGADWRTAGVREGAPSVPPSEKT